MTNMIYGSGQPAPPGTVSIAELHRKAAHYRWLARSISDVRTTDVINNMACELEREAGIRGRTGTMGMTRDLITQGPVSFLCGPKS